MSASHYWPCAEEIHKEIHNMLRAETVTCYPAPPHNLITEIKTPVEEERGRKKSLVKSRVTGLCTWMPDEAVEEKR